MVEETILIDSEEAQRRVSLPQCQRSMTDLQNQLDAQKKGESELKLVPEIFLCQQHLRNESHAHQSMVHELIHAIDMCRTKMDPLNNCVHMACTEIRAENLSGECDWWKEFMAGRMKDGFVKHGQQCVKRRAALSLKANPNCRDRAHDYVDAAFERCFRDTFPFDRHPNIR
jgi:inner membrane protease ATP23